MSTRSDKEKELSDLSIHELQDLEYTSMRLVLYNTQGATSDTTLLVSIDTSRATIDTIRGNVEKTEFWSWWLMRMGSIKIQRVVRALEQVDWLTHMGLQSLMLRMQRQNVEGHLEITTYLACSILTGLRIVPLHSGSKLSFPMRWSLSKHMTGLTSKM